MADETDRMIYALHFDLASKLDSLAVLVIDDLAKRSGKSRTALHDEWEASARSIFQKNVQAAGAEADTADFASEMLRLAGKQIDSNGHP